MRGVLDVQMRFSRHSWWLYLALVAPLVAAYLGGLLHAGPVYNVIGFSGVVAMAVGIRVNRPTARWAWYVLALGQVLFVGGDVLAYNYQTLFGEALPSTSIADVFYLSCYPVTGIGLLALMRQRDPGRDWASLIDSAVVTIGLALLSWIFLIAPLAHNGALPLGTKLVAIAYPLSDILILGIAVRLAVGSGRRSVSYYMMIGALVAVLAADSAYGWSLLHSVLGVGTLLDAGWIAAHLLFGAAALHPSMTTVSQPAEPKLRLTRGRILTIAVATLIAPVVVVISAARRPGSDTIIAGGAAIALFVLVVVRMVGLARMQEAAGERERAMRLAAEALVAATGQGEIVRAAEEAARLFAGAAAIPTVLQIEERGGDKWLVGPDPRSGAGEVKIPHSLLPQDLVDQLERHVAVDLGITQAVSLGLGATPVFAAPILVRGQLAGSLVLLDATGTSNLTRNGLATLAAQVGLALESAALTEAILRERSEARLSALVQHSTDVILVITPVTTVEYASASVREMLGYDAAGLVGRPLLHYVAEQDRTLFQPALDTLLAGTPGASQALEFRMRHADGRLLHTECFITNLVDNADVGGIVVNLRDITERKRFEEQLTYQAFHDPVTNLANQALFRDRVEHALNRRLNGSHPVVVLFLDLDDFKAINNTVGHAGGDRVLRIVSSRLQSALRVGDTVARLQGDEFAILIEDIANETAVSEVVEQVHAVIGAPLALDDREVSVQCSIGIAVAHSTAGTGTATRVDELLRDADIAMYQAKAAHGNGDRYFKPAMHEAVVEQLALRAELKAAVAAEELTLAYQPIFELRTGEISGYEALLRWEHPQRGTIPPTTFIPVAEDSGLIIPLGRWVLNRACEDAVAFQQADPDEQERFVSVNISARQLQRVEIVGEVRDALHSSGLDPSRLLLEITESVMIDDVDLAIERLDGLRELGVRVAVDDFGTGHSSLSYIRRLPIDILKIDKRFIDSVDADDKDGKLTAAIIGLARLLDLVCVAEGVERPAQHERLKELGCDYAQGFLLARPMTAAALNELLGVDTVGRRLKAAAAS